MAHNDETTSAGAAVGWLLSLPMLLVIGFFFVLPILSVALISFYGSAEGGVLIPELGISAYEKFFTDPFSREIVIRSIVLSLLVTLLACILTYPIALYLYRTTSSWKGTLVLLTVSPLLLSAVVRTYSWMLILRPLEDFIHWIGFANVRLVNDYPGVVIGLTHIMMPYMALCLLSGFGKIDPNVEDAASSLGATPARRFFRITLPLSLPGVTLGCLLTFVLAISAFVTPALLGGGRVFLLPTEIFTQALEILDWPLASAMSMVLLGLFILTMGLIRVWDMRTRAKSGVLS
ncbi:ABC transporter permease [Agrobacterium vitis]|uniref:ABC transporter permease n=1 Tax=Agrobacterium vitis TaxID=373 RepID=UPI001571CD7D|nr:ABC transporter permease [Agrobacterium vitis]NSZ19662.1 ABC transporter permease [Agrobacterium vitis]QZO06891.1 ABC transporter permease [Agrobacterium vitis]UJL91433.1 ABC transporter permease [Agrobacterium vitis]